LAPPPNKPPTRPIAPPTRPPTAVPIPGTTEAIAAPVAAPFAVNPNVLDVASALTSDSICLLSSPFYTVYPTPPIFCCEVPASLRRSSAVLLNLEAAPIPFTISRTPVAAVPIAPPLVPNMSFFFPRKASTDLPMLYPGRFSSVTLPVFYIFFNPVNSMTFCI